jgi:spore coat polysaccharide biosynthesis protein SpsF
VGDVVAIVQARMGSTRLPGKVLRDLAGQPVLERVVSRVSQASRVDRVVVATSVHSDDDDIVAFCADRGYACARGSEDDVLDRYYRVAKSHSAGTVVRVTADCPVIDPSVIDEVLKAFEEAEEVSYASNRLPPRRSAVGMDVEVLPFSVLERAWHEDDDMAMREHVTPYVYVSGRFTLLPVHRPEDDTWMRLTLDTESDLLLLDRICGHFGEARFGIDDIRALLRSNPEWLELNADIVQRVMPAAVDAASPDLES